MEAKVGDLVHFWLNGRQIWGKVTYRCRTRGDKWILYVELQEVGAGTTTIEESIVKEVQSAQK